MLIYALAISVFLGLAVILMVLLHHALVVEDIRYGARATDGAPPPPGPSTQRELHRAA